MEFSQLPIPESIQAGIRDCGFTNCTPIQELTLPLSLDGLDVAGQAQTGTGKTAAFLIAVFSRLVRKQTPQGNLTDVQSGQSSVGHGGSSPRALIIAPTRELVVQIYQDARLLSAHTSLVITAVYGGVNYDEQRAELVKGDVDVLIGTPGRLIDYYKQKTYRVSHVEALVIDEADRMFDMGFIADLRYLLRRLPPYDQRISMLFSATLSYRAQELSYEFMDSPQVISTKSEIKTVRDVTQTLFHVESNRKISLLVGILHRLIAENGDDSRVMLFVNTKRMGETLKKWLSTNGVKPGYLSGDVPQTRRLKVLQRFQAGDIPVLIATDVAGRGLHIDSVTHVINYDLPENAEDYVHRIGRTARAGAKGDAISLVDENGAYFLEAVEEYVGAKISVEFPEDALFAELELPARSPPETRSPREYVTRGAKRPSHKNLPPRAERPTKKPAACADVDVAAAAQPGDTQKHDATSSAESTIKKKRRRPRHRNRKPKSTEASQDTLESGTDAS